MKRIIVTLSLILFCVCTNSQNIDSLKSELIRYPNDKDLMLRYGLELIRNQPDSSISIAWKVIRNTKIDSLLYKSYKILGNAYWMKDDNDSAMIYLKKAIEFIDKSENSNIYLCRIYFDIANVLQSSNLIKSAIDTYQVSKSYLNKVNNQQQFDDMSSRILLKEAQLYKNLGIYEISTKKLLDAEKLIKANKNLSLLTPLYTELGSINYRLKNYDKAISFSKKGIENAKIFSDLKNQIALNENISLYFEKTSSIDSSDYYNEKAIKLFILYKSNNLYEPYYQQKGSNFLQKNKLDSALFFFSKAIEIYKTKNNFEKEAELNDLIGSTYMKKGELSLANKYLISSLNYFKKCNGIVEMKEIYSQLAYLEKLKNNFKGSYEYIIISDSLNEIILDNEKQESIIAQQIKYETSEKEQKIKEQHNLIEINKKKTNIILLSSILGLISILSIFYYVRNKSKAKALQNEKEKLAYQLDSIRGKIVPHFSGNILNAITYFFETNENDKAISYLSKFTELNKEILLCTEKPFRSLLAEKTFIENYIELEKLRYQDKLQFILYINKEVDLSINLPVLILHTFCENAIKHGIMSKKGKGVLNVSITNFDINNIEIIIEDDGIGRTEASKLDSISTKQGLKILFKQIELYNSENENKIVIEMNDVNNNKEVTGTKVRILMPIKFNFSA